MHTPVWDLGATLVEVLEGRLAQSDEANGGGGVEADFGGEREPLDSQGFAATGEGMRALGPKTPPRVAPRESGRFTDVPIRLSASAPPRQSGRPRRRPPTGA